MADQKLLLAFWNEKPIMEEVQRYFFAHLDSLALNKVYNKEGTEGIADAREAILEAFRQLDNEFSKESKKPTINSPR